MIFLMLSVVALGGIFVALQAADNRRTDPPLPVATIKMLVVPPPNA
jgi:uncharacterized protein YneF (UPF0154 family)